MLPPTAKGDRNRLAAIDSAPLYSERGLPAPLNSANERRLQVQTRRFCRQIRGIEDAFLFRRSAGARVPGVAKAVKSRSRQ